MEEKNVKYFLENWGNYNDIEKQEFLKKIKQTNFMDDIEIHKKVDEIEEYFKNCKIKKNEKKLKWRNQYLKSGKLLYFLIFLILFSITYIYKSAIFNGSTIFNEDNIELATGVYEVGKNLFKDSLKEGKTNERTDFSDVEEDRVGQDSKADLVKIEKNNPSFGKQLNLLDKPEKNRYIGYFFDSKTLDNIQKYDVSSIAINFSMSEKYGIGSSNFGAYWIGNLYFDEEKTQEILVKDGWKSSRVTINGKEIEIDKNGFLYTFKKGENIIEVDFLNNWHTTDFYVQVRDVVKKYTLDEVKNKIGNKDYQIWYVGGYETGNNDYSVDLSLMLPQKDTLIVLSSYNKVKWNLTNVSDKIIGIVYDGLEVNTDKKVPLYIVDKIGYAYKTEELKPLNELFNKKLGKGISDYTVDYNLTKNVVPQKKYQ